MSKVQEEEKKRKRPGHDELELEETTEACATRPRTHKRRKTTADLLPRQVNIPAKSPLGTTSKARFLWTTKTKEAFFEGLCKHGKDFEKICVFMNSKPHLKQMIPILSRNQVRFFFYRTWKLVSGYYAAIKQVESNSESSKQCDMVASTELSTAAPVGGAASTTKEYLTDEELFCDESQPPVNLAPMATENVVGGAKDELENAAAEEEMFSDEDRVTPVTADIEKDEISDNTEHESEDDTDEEPSPLEGNTEEQEGVTEEQEDPLPSVGGATHSTTQEQTSSGTSVVASVTGKVQVDGRMLPLDLVSLICYGKYRSKLQALGNKSEIGAKLYELVHTGISTIRYKGRRMQLKMPLCVALKNDNRSVEQGQDGIIAGGIPDKTDHMILKLTAYNSESWSYIQQLSFNPRLRVILPSNKTLSSTIKILTERWNLPEPEDRNSVKIYYWSSQTASCDDKERVGWCGLQMPCDQDDHLAVELLYDTDITLAEIAMKLQVKNNLELMYDISGLMQKRCTAANKMGSLLRVVKVASRNERITPRVLSRISPRKYLFGSPFQRLTHRVGFGSRSRVKLDFTSPKKSEPTLPLPNTSTTPPTTLAATPTNPEENTVEQSSGMSVIVQTPTSEGSDDSRVLNSNSQSQKSGVKNNNKKLKGNKRNRIVTFDEHQLNQSGSFSSIPIKDLLMLAQQQVNSFKSPKKGAVPPLSLSPQPSSPVQSSSQPRQVSGVTAVTIPNEATSTPVTTVTASSVFTTAIAGVSSLQQQEVGGAVSGGTGLPKTVPHTAATATVPNTSTMSHIMTSPATTTTCLSVTMATPVVTCSNSTSVHQDTEVVQPPPPPVQIRPAKIIQRPTRPVANQRSLIPQPLSFFNTSAKRLGAGGTVNGSLQSNQTPLSVAEDTGKVLKAAESIKQRQQQGALGKTTSSLNVQNLTVVQQIQLLALIQQYQTMQKPKSVATSQTPIAQPPEGKSLTPDPQHLTDETVNKSTPVSSLTNSHTSTGKESAESDTDLYKLMHAAPIKTTPKKLGTSSRPLPVEEVSSDTVNNLLNSLMNNQSDKHQQDLARLASETAELLPSFTAGLLQGRSDSSTIGAGSTLTDPLPELLLNHNDAAQRLDHLPPLDPDSNPLGLFNLDNLLEDQDASLSAFIAYLESPKKKNASNSLPDLFSHDQDINNIGSTAAHSSSSEEFSLQALFEENSQDLSNKFRELSNLLMQHNDTSSPFNT